jgi:ribosomal-protein-alanine N-acetyltransferase
MSSPQIALEPIAQSHHDAIQDLASDPEVAATTPLPHPYPENGATNFIAHATQARAQGTAYHYAILERGRCVGVCGLKDIDATRRSAEAGYWLGRPYWGRGIATAALRLLVGIARLDLGLRRITAHTLEHNERSVRVLEKLGFRPVRRELNANRLKVEVEESHIVFYELHLTTRT